MRALTLLRHCLDRDDLDLIRRCDVVLGRGSGWSGARLRIRKRPCAQCHGLYDKAPGPHTGAPSFPEIGRRRDPDSPLALLRQVTGQVHYAMPRRRTAAADRRALTVCIAEATERSDRR